MALELVRNIQRSADVTITAGGWLLSGRAELVEALERKVELVSRYPFFPAAPFVPVHAALRTVLRPLLLSSFGGGFAHGLSLSSILWPWLRRRRTPDVNGRDDR
jgi:hypothetical protein